MADVEGVSAGPVLDVVSADDDVDVSDALVELSLEHADRPKTASAAMLAAVSVLR
jgi:hypothetical protein